MSVFDVALAILRRPVVWLLRRWNWKSAIFSPSTRAILFLCVNLSAGWRAAVGAMLAELAYRAVTSGFYGALTQAFRDAEPEWAASMTVFLLLPVLQHSIELAIHVARGTPNAMASVGISVLFTGLTTSFNLYAMRRGALVVGQGAGSVMDDLRSMPRLVVGFVGWVIGGTRTLVRSSQA